MKKTEVIERLFESKKYGECIKVISKLGEGALEKNILRLKAYSYQRTNDYEKAMESWTTLLAQNQKNAEAFAERGVCKLHLGYKSVLDDFNTAVELEPENAYRYACRAFVKDKVGDLDGALIDYNTSLKLDPENEVTHNNVGLLQEKMGYQEHAQAHYKQADSLTGLDNEIKVPENPTILPTPSKNIWGEIRGMFSSKTEFKRFLKEASDLIRKR
jgi:tetratricopeptide (TPR) repeat protein